METKIKNNFKAVEFMRKVRSELSDLYYTDKDRYHKELRKTMEDFIASRKKPSANTDIAECGAQQ